MYKYLPFLLLSFLAFAEEEEFTDFLNPKTDVIVCSSFMTERLEALPIQNAKKNGKYQKFIRFSWKEMESNKVIIHREGKLIHVFHFTNSKNLKALDDTKEIDLSFRIRYNVLMETKNIKDKDLEKFYSSLIYEQVFEDSPKRPEGWEILAEKISVLSHGLLYNSSQSCENDCLVTFVLDKDATDLQVDEKCQDRTFYL